MNKEAIKATYNMKEIIARFGLKVNASGFIHCPFHKGDREPSMKIYADSYNCFGCGANGDIFTFVIDMENISFKEAFYRLGGTYKAPSFQSRYAVYKAKKEQEERRAKEERLRRKQDLNNALIEVYRHFLYKYEPLSDAWCDCFNALEYQLYLHEILNEKRW